MTLKAMIKGIYCTIQQSLLYNKFFVVTDSFVRLLWYSKAKIFPVGYCHGSEFLSGIAFGSNAKSYMITRLSSWIIAVSTV